MTCGDFCSEVFLVFSQTGLRLHAGESYLLLDRSLRHLVAHLAAPLAERLRTSWPVSLVDWRPAEGRSGSDGGGNGGGGRATLHGPAGQTLSCDRCARVILRWKFLSSSMALNLEMPRLLLVLTSHDCCSSGAALPIWLQRSAAVISGASATGHWPQSVVLIVF